MEKKKKYLLFIFNSKAFRIVAFLLFLIFILSIALKGVKYDKDQKYEYAYNYTLENKDIDIIFLSNSYIFTGFDPLYLKAGTGLKSVHLGHHGMSVIYDYPNVYNALQQFSPKCIVLDVSPPSLNSILPETDKMKYYAQKALVHSDVSTAKLYTMWDLKMYDDLNFYFESLSPSTASLVNIKSIKYSNFFQSNAQNNSSFLGFQPLNNSEKKKGESWNRFNETFSKSPDNKASFFDEKSISKKYLFKILDYTKEKGIKVVLVNSLKFAPTRGLNKLDSILQKHNYSHVHTFDMNNKRELINFSEKDFSDRSHLNHSGALKQTKVFADFIKDTILQRPIKNNSFSLNKFDIKSFNFVADNNGGFYSQIVMDSMNSKLLKNRGLKLQYYLKNKKKDSIITSVDNWVSVGSDMINTFKIPSKYRKNDIDSIEISERTYKPVRVQGLSKKALLKDCFKISKVLNNKYKFEFIIPDSENYEYVIYRYLDSKLIDPVHSYSTNNFMEFDAVKPVDQYRFDCFYRTKPFKVISKRVY